MVRLGRPAGVLEIRPWYWTEPLCVVDPLDPVARRAGQRLGRRREVLELLLGQQLSVAQDHALVTDEQLRAPAPRRHPSWRLAVALMPYELDWRRSRRRRRELVG